MKKLLMIFALFYSASGLADTTAKITAILVYEQANLIYIYPEGGVSNPLSCHGSNGDYISYSMARPMADEYFSALMAAYLAKKTVFFRTDDNQCIDQSVSETLLYFQIRD